MSQFPSTRYQGSKLKIADWIWENIRDLNFQTALDAFGGTGAVSHLLKRQGKTVVYNDLLAFNYLIGIALIAYFALFQACIAKRPYNLFHRRNLYHRLKHKGLKHSKSVWCDKNKIHDAFDRLFANFRGSTLVVSYRSNGIPSVSELTFLLQKHKGSVLEAERTEYQYVLSRKPSQEVLLIAR